MRRPLECGTEQQTWLHVFVSNNSVSYSNPWLPRATTDKLWHGKLTPQKPHIIQCSDILEDEILQLSPRILKELLKDHSATRAKFSPEQVQEGKQANIFWATDIYEQRYGKNCGYNYHDPITIDKITGENGHAIQPRVSKSRDEQIKRSRDKAEVFTPSWICNKQNNLIDKAWFERDNVFNVEVDNPDGSHDWIPTKGIIFFPPTPGKTWQKYVGEPRIEITCGEAPYLVSRYDTITGEFIPINKRIGLLDRKLRIIGENCDNEKNWLYYAKRAYQSTYGYDWQGDNVLIARESLLITFIEYFWAKFGKKPNLGSLQFIAYIISWNIWQMDGLKFVIPESCHDSTTTIYSLWGDSEVKTEHCFGCTKGDAHHHNGIYCLIRDWCKCDKITGKRFTDLPFHTLIKNFPT